MDDPKVAGVADLAGRRAVVCALAAKSGNGAGVEVGVKESSGVEVAEARSETGVRLPDLVQSGPEVSAAAQVVNGSEVSAAALVRTLPEVATAAQVPGGPVVGTAMQVSSEPVVATTLRVSSEPGAAISGPVPIEKGIATTVRVQSGVEMPVKRKRGRPPKNHVKPTGMVALSLQRKEEDEEEDVCFICFDGGSLVLCDRR